MGVRVVAGRMRRCWRGRSRRDRIGGMEGKEEKEPFVKLGVARSGCAFEKSVGNKCTVQTVSA